MRKDRKIIFSLALMMSLGMVASVNYGYAQYAIGTVYADEFENWSKAKKWWRKGAEKGNPFSQVMLGSYYALLGDGFEKPNYFLNVKRDRSTGTQTRNGGISSNNPRKVNEVNGNLGKLNYFGAKCC